MIKLGVNVDHVATLRQARREHEPQPVAAATACELFGADNITLHLREDRRHINEQDVRLVKEAIRIPLNLEMACADDVMEVACQVKPYQVTLVPEKREEVTTEGGLDLNSPSARLPQAIADLKSLGIKTYLFVDPDPEMIERSKEWGADGVELHTGAYARAFNSDQRGACLEALQEAAEKAQTLQLDLHAGHGLNLQNLSLILQLPKLKEVNIGHSLISRALFVGLEKAVKDIKQMIQHVESGRSRRV